MGEEGNPRDQCQAHRQRRQAPAHSSEIQDGEDEVKGDHAGHRVDHAAVETAVGGGGEGGGEAASQQPEQDEERGGRRHGPQAQGRFAS
jgi:hypothetical protein